MLSSSLHRPQSMDSWNSFSVKAKIGDMHSGFCTICLCSLPRLEFFMKFTQRPFCGYSLCPCPELALLECTNCCGTKGRLYPSLSHGFALLLHGVGLKLPVPPLESSYSGKEWAHGHPALRGGCVVCDSPVYLQCRQKSTIGWSRSPLFVCACDPAQGWRDTQSHGKELSAEQRRNMVLPKAAFKEEK